ncbi:UDP-glucose 4-epimerase [Methylophaga frappieri]|uniref:UDP-glucose 4-epimerase n=1 Tax=Methylophaga frappieri (strain ATCC BAA-2434 / DSM 25690 / JAM7) TaxID=754477 RepID=I1YKJ2_METFJ|nr:NAD-dependent epimerase/dehydratase family protein [Methylophaga frappieri]AFJ03435.1 UDP-glucose 4-epimerase [Methylophaga frappieri]
MTETVWITGGNSFTAGHLSPALKQAGYQVNQTAIDITDAAACDTFIKRERPDYIIHLAAISFVPAGQDAEIYAVNTLGTENVLKAATIAPPKKIILPSTSHIYGRQSLPVIDEAVAPAPVSHYGCSKLAMEYLAANYQPSLPIQIVRPFNYTGRGQAAQFLIPKLVSHFARRATTIQLGNIDVWRDISDVRWVVQAYLGLLTASPQGPLNLCRGEAISIREMLTMLEQLTGHQIKIEQDPALMRRDELPRQCGSQIQLRAALPLLPEPLPITETLAWMLAV